MFNQTFNIVSDRPFVNVGARNDFQDNFGTLVSTAVLVKSPANRIGDPNWAYRPTRVDLLMFARPNQATRSISDFFVTLFSDDGTDEHNPAEQLTTPFSLSSQTQPLLNFRATWYQQDITAAGWPIMPEQTYYWVVVSPGSPLTMPAPNNQYNGALWSGISAAQLRPDGVSPILPAFIQNDLSLFTGREMTSERFAGDSAFCANTQNAVNFLLGSSNWPSVPNAAPRFTNFVVSPPDGTPGLVRYGVQILGWQVTPSSSTTSSRKYPVF